MNQKLQYITGASICIAGAILQVLFLNSDRMMKSPVTYEENPFILAKTRTSGFLY